MSSVGNVREIIGIITLVVTGAGGAYAWVRARRKERNDDDRHAVDDTMNRGKALEQLDHQVETLFSERTVTRRKMAELEDRLDQSDAHTRKQDAAIAELRHELSRALVHLHEVYGWIERGAPPPPPTRPSWLALPYYPPPDEPPPPAGVHSSP